MTKAFKCNKCGKYFEDAIPCHLNITNMNSLIDNFFANRVEGDGDYCRKCANEIVKFAGMKKTDKAIDML